MKILPPIAILAGGLATRLYPITKKIPKALVEVAGEPFITHQLRLLIRNGINEIVICVGYLGEKIQDFLGDGKEFGVNLRYSSDGESLLGTAGALKKALPLLGEMFFVMNGDSYLDCDYQSVYKTFIKSDKRGLMTILNNQNAWDTSNVIFENGRIISYDKFNPSPEMDYIDYGLGMFNANVFEHLADGEPSDLAEIYKLLIEQDQLMGYEVYSRFYEIGSPFGLKETEDYLRR